MLKFLVLFFFSAAVVAAPEATIRFEAPTQYTDGTPITSGTVITYRLYQGGRTGEKTLVGTVTSGGKVTAGLQGGQEYCWEVTAVINEQESARSNSACKSFPFPIPTTVIITVE